MDKIPTDASERIEDYLRGLRKRLRGLNEQDVHDIAEEIRSHVLDKLGDKATAGSVASVLSAFGNPENLAGEYLTDNLLARAQVSRSPIHILEVLFRWASLSVAGFFVFLSAMVGYLLGVSLVLCALLKPIHPQTAGLWIYSSAAQENTISLRLGFGSAPPDGREVLGWWIVPIGLVLGCALVMFTTRFALSSVRRYRKSLALPAVESDEKVPTRSSQ